MRGVVARQARRPLGLGGAVLGVTIFTIVAACRTEVPDRPRPSPRVRVRSFTEATAVRALVTVPPYAFAATSEGLDRWDLRSGNRIHLGAEHGLSGTRVFELHYDPDRRWLWIATDAGLARYDLQAARVDDVPPPPPELAIDSLDGASLATDAGGVWVGLDSGLYRVAGAGQWSRTDIDVPVSALHRSAQGDLWVGTESGLFTISTRLAARLGREDGCDLARVRFIAEGPDGPVIVGENGAGDQRVALAVAGGCHTYRVSPNEPWLAATRRGDELMVLTPNRLYSMARPPTKKARLRLERDGMRLFRVLPTERGTIASSPYVFEIVERSVPAGAQTIAAIGDEVLVGTLNLGTARVETERRGRTQWLRRFELVDDATELSVACHEPDDCYVATGGDRVWRFNGTQFVNIGDVDRPVLAVVTGPKAEIYALRGNREQRSITIARVDHGAFSQIPNITIETPGANPKVSFARFAPSGVLWLGLEYRDDAGELRPYGIVLVDLTVGLVAYHHASWDGLGKSNAGLPIPLRVIDVAFKNAEETWLATTQGAVRVIDDDVAVFDESATGMRSELLRGVAITPGGKVFVASGSGVGVFDPDQRSFVYPRELRDAANDLEVSRDGRLWMATDRGLAVFDGKRVRRLDARRGLIEDDIADVAIDRYQRIWIRGVQGIALITP